MTAAPHDPPPTAGKPEGAGRLMICERSGQWAAALRRELADTGVRLWETNNLADCWQWLAASPASLVIVELTRENATDLLARLARLATEFPLARAVVVADRALADYKWPAREMGAVHFVSSPRALAPLAQLALRHLAAIPVPEQSLAERIWASLPWSEAGRGTGGEG